MPRGQGQRLGREQRRNVSRRMNDTDVKGSFGGSACDFVPRFSVVRPFDSVVKDGVGGGSVTQPAVPPSLAPSAQEGVNQSLRWSSSLSVLSVQTAANCGLTSFLRCF